MIRELLSLRARGRSGWGLVALIVVSVASMPGDAWAGKADVVGAEARREASGTYHFKVTVRHHDEGWKHYANSWEVVGPDGAVLGTRVLYHPHETEQPFTRSLGGVTIPDGVDEVTIRALDLKHGAGGKELTIKVPR